jgi:hydroxymethylbilane synthase
LVRVETEGDRDQQIPIDQMAGRGVFVAEVRLALLDGRADIAVHSAKDLPSAPELAVEGLVIAAVPERGDPRDALVGCSLEQLPPGATVATGAVRRRAQLAWLRPDLGFVGLRGNIGTRLDRVPPGGAVLMAAVALERLGMAARIAEILPRSVMMPQVGQGAMAVECRAGDSATRALLSRIDHRPSSLALAAERAFLGRLGGGCDLPIGAHATVVEGVGEPEIELEALVASPDGHVVVTGRLSGQDPQMLGEELAIEVIERRGGRVLLGYDYTPRGG